MPLTPEEQAEMASLQKELAPAKGGLTPDEQAEMAALQKEVGGAPQSVSQTPEAKEDNLLQRGARMAASPGGFLGSAWGNMKAFANAPAPSEQEQLEANRHPIAGTPPAALPMGGPLAQAGNFLRGNVQGAEAVNSAPAAVGKLAQFLGGNAATRVGTMGALGAGQGALQTPQGDETRAGNAARGLGHGVAAGATSEALGALIGGVSKLGGTIKRGYQMYSGSPGLEAETRGALSSAKDALTEGDSMVTKNQALQGKTASVDPRQLVGHDPEVDEFINQHIQHQSPYGGTPRSIDMQAEDLDAVRQKLDARAKWRAANPAELDPKAVSTGSEKALAAADYARVALHGLGDDVSGAYDKYSSDLNLGKPLGKVKNPVNWMSGQTPGRIAQIRQIEEQSGVPLTDLADSMRAARKVASHPASLKSLTVPAGQLIKGASRSLANPSAPSSLLDILQLQGTPDKK